MNECGDFCGTTGTLVGLTLVAFMISAVAFFIVLAIIMWREK